MPATLHPTKEQVRAYMQLRECARRPPPMPEEIRRQLGWRYCSSGSDLGSASTIFLPSTIAQLAALMAVEWCFLASGLSRSN
ncbi:MAG TPA: hypothetical protein VF616_10015 [Duganella sp.]|uniref:hypothetical protein n=1 Tax=Duganella sp. TaxID=1904440 RepID=UPI002ED31391